MIDLVFNHTSTEHIWFKKAMKGDKKYQDYYIFKESIDQYKDIEKLNHYKILMKKGVSEDKNLKIMREKSSDNSRTPMQWNNDENAGFIKGNSGWV